MRESPIPIAVNFLTIQFPCRRQALAAKAEAEKEGIVVPTTLEDYCIKPKFKPTNPEPQVSCSWNMRNKK